MKRLFLMGLIALAFACSDDDDPCECETFNFPQGSYRVEKCYYEKWEKDGIIDQLTVKQLEAISEQQCGG